MKNSFINKKNLTVILIAILFGLITVFPRIMAIKNIGFSYFKGIYPFFVEDELHYAARVNAVVNTGVLNGSPYLSEYVSMPFTQFSLPELVISILVWLTNFSVPLVLLISIFVFCVGSFLSVYLLFLDFSENRKVSLFFSATFFLLFIQTFGRPISPQLNIIFLNVGLLLCVKLIKNLDNRARHLLVGVVNGLLLYISPYYWTTLMLFYFSVVFLLVYTEKNISNVKKMVWYLVGFVPFLFLYIFFTVSSLYLPGYSESAVRFGMIHSHFPGAYHNVFWGFISLIVVYLFRSEIGKKNFLILLIPVTGIIILNWQNVITGIYFQYSSHYLVVTYLYLLMVLAYLFVKVESVFYKRILIFLVVVIFAFLFYLQKYEFSLLLNQKVNPTNFLKQQSSSELFGWINNNTPQNSTFLTFGSEYDSLIPVYTNNKVYSNFYLPIFPIPTDEIENRWLINNYFEKDFSENFVYENERYIWGNKFIDSYFYNINTNRFKSVFGLNKHELKERVPKELINEVVNKKYKFERMGIDRLLKIYNVDYLLLDKNYISFSKAEKEISKMDRVNLEKEINDIIIYKVKK